VGIGGFNSRTFYFLSTYRNIGVLDGTFRESIRTTKSVGQGYFKCSCTGSCTSIGTADVTSDREGNIALTIGQRDSTTSNKVVSDGTNIRRTVDVEGNVEGTCTNRLYFEQAGRQVTVEGGVTKRTCAVGGKVNRSNAGLRSKASNGRVGG